MAKTTKKIRFKIRRFLRKRGKGILTTFTFFVIMFIITMIIFPPMKSFIFNMFIVENIKINGVEYNDVSDLKQALDVYKGRVNWTIDREELKKRLKSQFRWIKSVAISNLPSKTLVLYIEEEEPVVFYRDRLGELWIVGEQGEILNRYHSRKFGYLYLPILQCDEKLIPYVVSKLNFLKEKKEGEDFLRDVSEIIVNSRDSKWTVLLKGFKGRLLVDPLGQFKNIHYFLRLKNRIVDDVGETDYVDISFDNQIIVKKRD